MSYQNRFSHADDVVNHLNTVVPTITNPLLVTKYVGFVSVSAVTVYEQAIKDIFIQFAHKKHKVLGNFTEEYFRRINGRIKISVIEDDYIKKFGEKYRKRFRRKIQEAERSYLVTNRRDIRSSYSNLITWRNDFAHEGNLSSNATYNEVVRSYEDGKNVIHCLAQTMVR